MGLNEALDWLPGNAWGGWLLAGMAGGPIAFGADSLVEAPHRRIDPPIMPAFVRALMTNPTLLIMDEATEGLAPMVRREIWRGLGVVREHGQSILLIDKNLDELMKIADRHYIMENGAVVWSGKTEELSKEEGLKSRYLGV